MKWGDVGEAASHSSGNWTQGLWLASFGELLGTCSPAVRRGAAHFLKNLRPATRPPHCARGWTPQSSRPCKERLVITQFWSRCRSHKPRTAQLLNGLLNTQIVDASIASKLENLMRAMTGDPEVAQHPPAFAAGLEEATRLAQELEDALVARAPEAELKAKLQLVNASCKSCHVKYRDTKKLSP